MIVLFHVLSKERYLNLKIALVGIERDQVIIEANSVREAINIFNEKWGQPWIDKKRQAEIKLVIDDDEPIFILPECKSLGKKDGQYVCSKNENERICFLSDGEDQSECVIRKFYYALSLKRRRREWIYAEKIEVGSKEYEVITQKIFRG